MAAALKIVKRDLTRFIRNPGRTALLLAIPLSLAAIMALVFGGGGMEQLSIRVLLHDEDDSILSKLLDKAGSYAGDAQRLDLVLVGEEGVAMMEAGEASALIHIPQGFTDDFLAGRSVTLDVVKNPAQQFLPQVVEEGVNIGAVLLSQASRVLRPELARMHQLLETDRFPGSLEVGLLSAGMNEKLRGLERYVFPPIIDFESVTLKPDTQPDQPDQAADVNILSFFLPGLLILGILFLAQAATHDILREREAGMLRHLLTAPVSVADYLAGKCISVVSITSIGFGILMAFGAAAGVSWGQPLAAAALVVASSLAAGGTLLLIVSLSGSERQADVISTIVIIVWSMIGGSFFPLSQLPAFLHSLSQSSLNYWAADGFHTLILRGGGLADIAANLAVLAGGGVVFMAIGAWALGRRIKAGLV